MRGGIAASAERLALALQEAGHSVIIYSFALQYPGFLFPGKTQYTDDPAPPGLEIRTRLNSVNPLNWIRVGLEIAREAPDRIICRFWLPFMGPALGTVLRIARRRSRKPVRITALVDNIVPHEKRAGDRWFAQYFVDACDDFVVMSRSVEREIRLFTPDKPVRFAPHPIYDSYGVPVNQAAARQELGLPPTVPMVLFFGFIRAYKGLDLLLEALNQPALINLDVHAVVAGESYEDWVPYQAIIERTQMSGRVHLHTDFIAADRVRWYFSAADLVVQPYKSATQSGISQIAYHFDKPMVVTDVGGLPEIVTDGISGYVVAPVPEAIAEAVADFFQNERASAMQAGVREEKRRFNWEYLVDKLLEEPDNGKTHG